MYMLQEVLYACSYHLPTFMVSLDLARQSESHDTFNSMFFQQ